MRPCFLAAKGTRRTRIYSVPVERHERLGALYRAAGPTPDRRRPTDPPGGEAGPATVTRAVQSQPIKED